MSNMGDSLLRGAQETLAYAKGVRKSARIHRVKVPAAINVQAIRDQLKMTRTEFADHFGFSLRTLEKWEQGLRKPQGPARAYLKVIEFNPQAVEAALSS